MRETWINIVVDNYVYGIYPNATITTNGNGTVLVSMNGRNIRYNLTEAAQRVGDTYVLIVPFDTLYDPGNYSMAAVYMGDDYFDYSLNQTNFTVFKKNTTIVANPTNISFWDVEDINVTVDVNATGNIKININGQEYVAEIIGGLAQFHIANLFSDNYTNVEVYYGGDPCFNGNTTYINFTVGPSSNFQVNVTAPDIVYGHNATIYVNMPSLANGTATINIDGVKKEDVPVVNGVAILTDIEGLAVENMWSMQHITVEGTTQPKTVPQSHSQSNRPVTGKQTSALRKDHTAKTQQSQLQPAYTNWPAKT